MRSGECTQCLPKCCGLRKDGLSANERLERGADQREGWRCIVLAWPGIKHTAASANTPHGARPQARAAARAVSWLCFVWIELQWHTARWAPGVFGLIMDGIMPARVPEAVITEIRKREVGGLIELERKGIRRGDRVRVTQRRAGRPDRPRRVAQCAIRKTRSTRNCIPPGQGMSAN